MFLVADRPFSAAQIVRVSVFAIEETDLWQGTQGWSSSKHMVFQRLAEAFTLGLNRLKDACPQDSSKVFLALVKWIDSHHDLFTAPATDDKGKPKQILEIDPIVRMLLPPVYR